MKKTISFRRSAKLIIVVMLVLSIAMLALIYIVQSNRALQSMPLVLIHSPLNREHFQVGEGVNIHATARGSRGLRSVELWVNDTFVDLQDAPADGPTNSLTFSGSWLATTAGSNVVIVRAIAADGTAGQASVVIEVSEREGEVAGLHTVRQGDTLRSIAEEYDVDPDLVELANPGLDPNDLGPGDEIYIPDPDEPPADDPPADAPPADAPPPGDPPPPEGDAPGSGLSGLGLLDDLTIQPVGDLVLQPLRDFFADLLGTEREEDQVRLQLELLTLTTSTPFEELYLYISYGDFPQHRFPDEREDLGLGGSIRILSTEADGTTLWDLSAATEIAAMPLFGWRRNQNLPFSLTLVGVIEGGTDDVPIYFDVEIPPENWTGMPLSGSAVSDGGDYNFAFTYSISQLLEGIGFEAYTDHSMTPPENARFDLRRPSLRWDYNPRPDEEPIDGFRIYLNNSLLWVEPARARESRLPPEWLNPPCGTTYTFAVTAYRVGIPDGPESLPAETTLQPEAENCQREVLITFTELETFNLGGDGRRPPHRGDVGPVYGHFYANDQRIEFNTNPGRGTWGGTLGDDPDGFYHHTRYNLAELAANPDWHFVGRPSMLLLIPDEVIGWIGPEPTAWGPSLLVEIPEDVSFQFGFEFWDEDYGRCRRPSDPGCDDLIAEASHQINRLEELDHHREGVLAAYNGRCQVRYVLGPAPGSQVGSGVEGQKPLPWIILEDYGFEVDDDGRVRLHVRNVGSASWPSRELKVELQNRDGTSIGVYTWPNFSLAPGQRTVLEHPSMILDPPYDACVLIDPYNEVLQERERRGAGHFPICQPAPDLVIDNVGFIPGAGSGQLAITIRNIGQGPITNRTVSFAAYSPIVGRLDLGGAEVASAHNVTLERSQSTTLIIGEISSHTRLQMHEGYAVTVDPENLIYERSTDNNSFDVPAGGRLEIVLYEVSAPYSMRNKSIDYEFTASVISDYGHSRNVVLYQLISNPDWNFKDYHEGCRKSLSHASGNFLIFGDESLEVTVNVSSGRDSWSSNFIYLPRHTWGAAYNAPMRFGSSFVDNSTEIPTQWYPHKFFMTRQRRNTISTSFFIIS